MDVYTEDDIDQLKFKSISVKEYGWRKAGMKNMTVPRYKEMYLNQKGLCACCGIPLGKNTRNIMVDHNHITKEVRGLIHRHCNFAIGHIKEDLDMPIKIFRYLIRTDSYLRELYITRDQHLQELE